MRQVIIAIVAYCVLNLFLPKLWEALMSSAPRWIANAIWFLAVAACVAFAAFSDPVYTRIKQPANYPLSSTITVAALLAALGGAAWWIFLGSGAPKDIERQPANEIFTFAIQSFEYDDKKQELESIITFNNRDSVARVVMSVVFFYRTKEQRLANNGEMKILVKEEDRRRLPFLTAPDPIYVEPGRTAVKTFTTLVDPSLLTQHGTVFGVLISTLNANGGRNMTTVEAMDLLSGFPDQDGPVRAAMLRGPLSLDNPWSTVFLEMHDPPGPPTQPSPTPSREASPTSPAS